MKSLRNLDPKKFKTTKIIGKGVLGKIYLKIWKKNDRKYAINPLKNIEKNQNCKRFYLIK